MHHNTVNDLWLTADAAYNFTCGCWSTYSVYRDCSYQKFVHTIFPCLTSVSLFLLAGNTHFKFSLFLTDNQPFATRRNLLVSRYRNQVVDSTYNDGCFQYNVEAENVRVLSPDGFLELGAEKRVLIKSSFFVEKGAGLHIYNVIYNEEDDWWDKKNNH